MDEFVVAEDGLRIAFERVGEGAPVFLVHGFGSSREQNWKSTGWYRSLTEAGRQVVAMDCRGHGKSDKPHDPAFYGHQRMAEDAIRVMDQADISSCDLVGYSMGGYVGLRVAAGFPDRVRRLAVCGVGENYLKGGVGSEGSRQMLAEALLTEDKSALTDPRAKMFRAFAEQPGKDRIALAACMRAMSPSLGPDALAHLQQKVLVACGDKDDISGPPGPLASALRQGEFVVIPGRDHMSAVGDPGTRRVVLKFLEL